VCAFLYRDYDAEGAFHPRLHWVPLARKFSAMRVELNTARARERGKYLLRGVKVVGYWRKSRSTLFNIYIFVMLMIDEDHLDCKQHTTPRFVEFPTTISISATISFPGSFTRERKERKHKKGQSKKQ
jgi:hypothetical protein